MNRSYSAIFLLTLALGLPAPAADLYLSNGATQGSSLTIEPGGTGTIDIVLELQAGESFGFATVFLDTVPEDSSALLEVTEVNGPLAAPFTYDRSAFDLPATLSADGGNEYGLVMGQGSVDGPATLVLDTITVHALGEGSVDVIFELGARQPTLFSPTFSTIPVAPVGLEPGFSNFVYLGVGDGRTGGTGPFVVTSGDAPPPNDNQEPPTNDNTAPPPNDNTPSANDNVPTNDNTAANANDNVPVVVRPDEPEVDLNENQDSDFLGTVEDSDGQIAVFVDRDAGGNPIAINGLVLDFRGTVVKVTIEGNLLLSVQAENGDFVDFAYSIQDGSVSLVNQDDEFFNLVLPSEIDLADAANVGLGAIDGEVPSESMERLLDELNSVMGPIVDALADSPGASAFLAPVGGTDLLAYAFQTSANSVEDAVTGDNVTDGVDFGDLDDANIDDPIDDLVDLTEPDAGTPPRPDTGGGGGGSSSRGFCGFGLLGGFLMNLVGLFGLRLMRRATQSVC